MIRLQKKLSQDNEGISGWAVLVIIVLGLLFWQFGFPLLNLDSLSITTGIEEIEPEELTFSAGLFNTETNLYRATSDILIDLDPNPRDEHENLLCYDMTLSGDNAIDNHQVIIKTNAPKKLTNPYRVIIRVEQVFWNHNTDTQTIYTNPITSGVSGEKTFKRQLLPSEIQLSGALNEYSVITCRLLDYQGYTIFSEEWSVR